jgi:proton-dependent oligopeptide transporter, POT family
MGTWFFASATGNFAAGLIAAATGSGELEGESPARPRKSCSMSTPLSAGSPSASALLVILLSPLIKKLMHLDTLRDEFPQDETKPSREEW